MSARLITACCCVGFLLSASSLLGQEEARDNRIAELRQKAIHAEGRAETGNAFRELFAFVDDRELSTLKADIHPGIALFATWRLRRSDDKELASSAHPERFIGFLEGRTGLVCPPSWGNWLVTQTPAFNESWLTGALRTYGPLGLIELQDKELGLKPGEGIPCIAVSTDKFEKCKVGKLELDAPADTRIRNDCVEVDSKLIPLKPSFLNSLADDQRSRLTGRTRFRFYIDGQRTFVALWSLQGVRFPLYCLNTKSGELLWKVEIWGDHSEERSILGPTWHHVEMSVGRGAVGVFGVTPGNCYVEAFDVETGRPMMRFNPGMWDR